MRRWSPWVAAGAALPVMAAVLYPLLGSANAARELECFTNTKAMGTALALYAADENSSFPESDRWMESAQLYSHSYVNYHCVMTPAKAFGYAYNSLLSDKKLEEVTDVSGTPLAYDSKNLARDASDPFTSLPKPGRHNRGKSNNVAFADAHARTVPVK